MKITHGPTAVPTTGTVGQRPADTARPPAAGSGNRVQSPSLNDVAAQLKASGEVDLDKVRAIRQAIADGQLPMDLDRLAEAVLDLHRR